MMNERVRAAILSLSTVSNNARKIADRLGVDVPASLSASTNSEDIQALKTEIETLTTQLSELRNYVSNYDDDDEEKEMSEEEQTHFKETFTLSLADQPFVIPLQVYDDEYLSVYPRNIRFLICTALVNWCTHRKFDPAPLWYNVMVNNGSM